MYRPMFLPWLTSPTPRAICKKGEHVAFAGQKEPLSVMMSPGAVKKHPAVWKEIARASVGRNCPITVLHSKAELAAALAKDLKSCRWVGLKGELQDMEAQVETVCHTGLAAIAAVGVVVTMSGFCAGLSGCAVASAGWLRLPARLPRLLGCREGC